MMLEFVLNNIRQAIKECSRILKWGAGIQKQEREELVKKLQNICLNCEDSFSSVLKRFEPVKKSYGNSRKLANELHSFTADSEIRKKAHPVQLCGDLDDLMTRLNNNLDPLKYSVHFCRVRDLKESINLFGRFDNIIYQSQDDAVSELDQIATEICDSSFDATERVLYAKRVIREFEDQYRSILRDVLKEKGKILKII